MTEDSTLKLLLTTGQCLKFGCLYNFVNFGRFVPEKFEELFSKFARGDKKRLNFWELLELTNSQMNAYDFFGWNAEKLEWLITYLLIKDAEGFVSKEHIRGMYDGSLFQTMAKLQQRQSPSNSILHKTTKNN